SENIYWTDIITEDASGKQHPGTVKKLALDGSSAPVTLDTQLFPSYLALDGTTLYWGSESVALDPATELLPLRRVSLPDGTAETVMPPQVTGGLTRCPNGVCWTDPVEGTVMRFEACSP